MRLSGAERIGGGCGRIAVLLTFAISSKCMTQQLAGLPSTATGRPVCVEESAKHAIALGQFKDAEEALRRSIAADPLCSEARFLLGYALLRQDLPKESLAEYTAAARLRAPTPADLRNVALDYVLLNDYADADHWVQRALKSDGNDAETWYVLGRIRYGTGKFQDAVDAFKHTLSIDPESVKAEDNLGLAYQSLNEADQAIDAYRQAIAFGEASGHPSAQPMIDLGIALDYRSDQDEALAVLMQAVALAPEDARAREHLGHVYLELNRLPQAQAQLEKAVSLSPSDARLHFLLGQIYRREGINEKANVEFARFTSLNGTHSTPDYPK